MDDKRLGFKNSGTGILSVCLKITDLKRWKIKNKNTGCYIMKTKCKAESKCPVIV